MADENPKPDPFATHTYVVRQPAWIGPHLKATGDKVEMTEAEAQYYVPHVLTKQGDMPQEKAPAESSKAASQNDAKAGKGGKS